MQQNKPTYPGAPEATRDPVKLLRFKVIAEDSEAYAPESAEQPADVAAMLSPMLEGEPNETFLVVGLNHKNKVVGVTILYRGGTATIAVEGRDVFRAALAMPTVTAVILAHNHPSGDPQPPTDDIATTKKLIEAGEIVDICVLDHIVIGSVTGKWRSMRADGTVRFSSRRV